MDRKPISKHTNVDDVKPDLVPQKTFEPVKDFIAVHVHKPAKNAGIIIPDDSGNPYQGPRCTVIAVGPEVKSVKEGDLVLIHPMIMAADIFCCGYKYVMIREEHVAGVLLNDYRDACLNGSRL